MKEVLYDYYFSQKQKEIREELGNKMIFITIDGNRYEYTSMVEHGTKNSSKFNDIIFLGSAMNLVID